MAASGRPEVAHPTGPSTRCALARFPSIRWPSPFAPRSAPSSGRTGELVAEEEYPIDLMIYFKDELVMMLERAGFEDVEVRGGYDGGAPTPDHRFLVFSGMK